jgi:hypothetical protein
MRAQDFQDHDPSADDAPTHALICSADCRPLQELEALQEALLALPEVRDLQSPALDARLKNSSDLAAAVFSRLRTGEPSATWALLQADAAKKHPRWVEVAVRVMESAASRGFDVDLDAWYAMVAQRVKALSAVPPQPVFRRMSIEAQMELSPAVELTAEQEAAARTQAAAALGSEPADDAAELLDARSAVQHVAQWRDAAARILQARLPQYVAQLHARRAAAAARRTALAWQARACALRAAASARAALAAPTSDRALAAMWLYACALQLAERSQLGTVLLDVAAGAWDAFRALLAIPGVLVSHTRSEWAQRAPGDEAAAGQPLWSLSAAPASTGRALTVVLAAILSLLEALRDGKASMHSDTLQAPDYRQATHNPDASADVAGLSATPWFRGVAELDMPWLSTLCLGTLNVLLGLQRPGTALSMGQAWRRVSCGLFDDALLPVLVSAAEQAGSAADELSRDLAAALRGVSEAQQQLRAARADVQEAIGINAPFCSTLHVSADKPNENPADSSGDQTKIRLLVCSLMCRHAIQLARTLLQQPHQATNALTQPRLRQGLSSAVSHWEDACSGPAVDVTCAARCRARTGQRWPRCARAGRSGCRSRRRASSGTCCCTAAICALRRLRGLIRWTCSLAPTTCVLMLTGARCCACHCCLAGAGLRMGQRAH